MANTVEKSGFEFTIPFESAPNDVQRNYLQRQFNSLTDGLHNASRDDIIREIAMLFRMMAVKDCDPDEMGAVIEVYAADLRELPLWAVSAACGAYRMGTVGDGIFAPKVGELRRYALAGVQKLRNEREKINRVLSAAVLPKLENNHADVAARVRQMAADCVKDLQRAGDLERWQGPNKPDFAERGIEKTEKERAQAFLDAMELADKPKITLSDEARALFHR